jgi:hypothetical protein
MDALTSIWEMILGISRIAPLIIAFGSFVTAFFAIKTFRENRAQNKRDTTVSMITRMTCDGHVTEMMEKFRQLRYHLKGMDREIKDWESAKNTQFIFGGRSFDASRAIKDMYNFYEVLALGVEKGWLDESIIRSFWRTSYVLDWLDFQDVIVSFGNESSEVFKKYENMAYQWANIEERKKFRNQR